MVYKFKVNMDKDEFKKFAQEQEILNFMQEYEWAFVKDGWKHFHCGLYKDGKLVATAMVLKRSLPLGISFMYVPRGFLVDYTDLETVNVLTQELKKLAKQEKSYCIKIDPNFCYKEYSIKEIKKNETVEIPKNYSDNYEIKHQNLLDCGYRFHGYTKSIDETIQPRYHMYIPLVDKDMNMLTEDEVKKSFKKSTRSCLGNYHLKRGIYYFHTSDKKYLDMFMEVINDTAQRQNIHLRNKGYFEKMMDQFKDEAILFFGMMKLEEYLEFIKEKNNEKEIAFVEGLIAQGKKEIPLSASFVIAPKNKGIRTSEYLYAGNNLSFSKLNVSAGLVYDICKYSIENHIQYCNLGGINGTFDDHLTPFKSHFNPIVFEFAGEYDLPVQKIRYCIYEFFMPMMKKIYAFIRSKM